MIKGQRKELLVTEMTVRRHVLLSDVAERLGGHDEGPDPHEYLEAALTACTIITAQMYANRKSMKLELTDVIVKVESEGAQTVISRQVAFRGDLSAEEKARLTEIVNKCPIHRLLTSQVTVNTTVT